MLAEIMEGLTTIGGLPLMIIITIILKHLLDKAASLESGQEELKQDNVALLRSRIKERGDIVLERKCITYEEAEDLDHLYDRYKKEGGNSFVKELMERVHKLPLEDNKKRSH